MVVCQHVRLWRVREILATVYKSSPRMKAEAKKLGWYLVDMASIYGRIKFSMTEENSGVV